MARALRDTEHDEDADASWAATGMPRRKGHSAAVEERAQSKSLVGGMQGGAANARRTPEPVDPWQIDPQHDAWRGVGPPPDLSGLPSIHGGFLGNDGSRAPSRLAVSTPPPREEDSLDIAARQLGGAGLGMGGGRWGNEFGLGLGARPELGPVRGPHDRGGPLSGLSRRPDLSGAYRGH